MTVDWNARIDTFWEHADDSDPAAALAAMRELIGERPTDDPDAQFEWASVHDFLGLEKQAIPLYEAALEAGLSGDRLPQALIQLASSLRNVGRAHDAIHLLRNAPQHRLTGDADQAFLALALHTAGDSDAALRAALTALAKSLPMYSGAITRYANDLTMQRECPLMIRAYEPSDAAATHALCLSSITTTAARDYTSVQIAAWVRALPLDLAEWNAALQGRGSFVATCDGQIIGFSDVSATGYIDMLFVDPGHTRRGVASALLLEAENRASSQGATALTIDASITARGLCERRGFTLVREQYPVRNGIALVNYSMQRELETTHML